MCFRFENRLQWQDDQCVVLGFFAVLYFATWHGPVVYKKQLGLWEPQIRTPPVSGSLPPVPFYPLSFGACTTSSDQDPASDRTVSSCLLESPVVWGLHRLSSSKLPFIYSICVLRV